MPRKTPDHLLWIDFEGTGTDPILDDIIEVGAILTDMELNIVDRHSDIVVPCNAAWQRMMNLPPVLDMHTKNGLIDDLKRGNGVVSQYVAESNVIDMLDRNNVNVFWIAGSGVSHYDAPVINKRWPRVQKRLNDNRVYWQFDSGHIRRFWHDICDVEAVRDYNVETDKSHRALDDIEDHIAEVILFRDAVRSKFPRSTPRAVVESLLEGN